MGRGTNNGANGRLYITTTPELRQLLDGLATLGIHGGSASEVARHLVENEIDRMVRESVIPKTIEARRLVTDLMKAKKPKAG